MSEQENKMGYKFKILSEDAATHDLFEDKTHERVSENLYKIILDSPKAVTIGLEGAWGSGKSTVIKLLRDKLTRNAEDKTLFFMFDAWAHDGDPLRRIFLESLIREIDPTEDDEDLKEIKGKITGRKKIVEVKAKKSTSRLGKWISLSALLIPLGSALLGKVNYEHLVWPWSEQANNPHILFILGLILCICPLFVLAYWYRWGDKDPKTNKVSWEFFSVDSREDYTQDITEDGERTSIEFEDHFKCIIQTATSKALIDKCIVVIDNLDRVDPAHAKNIWSTLQTFFQNRSIGNQELNWSNKLWFVIPFDRDGFHKIWKSGENDGETGKSFLKKCFQLIAEVPHPVMSGWSSYAEACINESLNQWPERERQRVFSTYVRYASRLDKSPTPRDIKVFANQVGLLGAMWGGDISVEAICLYTLFKESFTTNQLRINLIAGQLPEVYQTDAELSDICAELAGLLFGVSKDKGIQLLLGPEIHTALRTSNGDHLSSLVNDHGNAFWIAYQASKSEWMITESHTDEYRIAFTKAFYSGLMEHKDRLERDIDSLVNIWLGLYAKLDFTRFDYSDSISSLSKLCKDENKFIDSMHQITTKKLSEIVSVVGSEKSPESSLVNFEKIIKFLKIKNKPLKRTIYPKLTVDKWRIWVSYLENQNVSYEFVLPSDETLSAIANEVQFYSASVYDIALQQLIHCYDIYPESSEWDLVAENIISWMNLRNRSHECEFVYSLAMRLLTGKNEKISIKIKDCIKGHSFWVKGQSSSLVTNPSLALMTAIAFEDMLQKNESVPIQIKSFWSDMADKKALSDIFNRLEKIGKLDVLWFLCRDVKNGSAIEIIKSSDNSLLYSSWVGTDYIDEYKWANADEMRIIAEKLVLNGSFFSNQQNMKDDPITYQEVYGIFYPLKNQEVCLFIDGEIDKITKEEWLVCFEKNSALLDLTKDKKPHFSDAIKEFLVGIVSGADIGGLSGDLLQKMPILLRKSADLDKTIIPKVITEYFSASKDCISDELFNVLRPFFESHLWNVDEKLVMERINVWIDSNSKERIDWLTKQKIKPFEELLETLTSRIEIGLKSDDTIKAEIASLVNEKFSLGVSAIISGGQETELEST
ncbi:P-loop NTPase fold protein [Rheinheimera faecalis]